MKNYIQKILGLDIIQEQNRIKIGLLKDIIELQKHGINNDCLVHSDKTEVR